MSDDLLRLYAAWMLTHDMADEGMRAAIARGQAADAAGMGTGSDAFVDGLMAAVAEEKERLVAELAERGDGPLAEGAIGARTRDAEIDELRFEIGEVRGRLDAIERLLESLDRKLGK